MEGDKFKEQKKLATIIKSIHQELRNSAVELGAEKAWSSHLEDKEKLELYANSMRELSERHWKERNSSADDRIQWIIKSCDEYFQEEVLENHRKKEMQILEKLLSEEGHSIDMEVNFTMKITDKLKVIDVGSSGNFFKDYSRFDILPIDIAPSSNDVFFCDFLSVALSSELTVESMKIRSLPKNHFDVAIFSMLLEYLPTSEMRVSCCEKAYEILKTEGILCIITPDSNSQHKNAQQIKAWKWTLAKMGFKRVKVEKLTNLSCMVFRKALSEQVSKRWADFCKETYAYQLEIPQDRLKVSLSDDTTHDTNLEKKDFEFNIHDMQELPFQ